VSTSLPVGLTMDRNVVDLRPDAKFAETGHEHRPRHADRREIDEHAEEMPARLSARHRHHRLHDWSKVTKKGLVMCGESLSLFHETTEFRQLAAGQCGVDIAHAVIRRRS